MSFELGDFSFRYRSLAVHGFGISASSNFAVLYQASQLFFKHGPPASREEIARKALEFDRRQANDLCVAADDVYPIVYGGVVTVHTTSEFTKPDNGVSVTLVTHDARWIADHVAIAFRPKGKRHDVPNLLANLFQHARRTEFVNKIRQQAEDAAAAISADTPDVEKLADSVNQYRNMFNEWTENRYINEVVNSVASDLNNRCSGNILAWKPPGAGASEAIAIITPDKNARDVVLDYFLQRSDEWWCSPVYVSTGLCSEFIHSDGHVRFTAGHRL